MFTQPALSGFVIQALYVVVLGPDLTSIMHFVIPFCPFKNKQTNKQTKKPGGLVTCRARNREITLRGVTVIHTVVVIPSAWEEGGGEPS